MTNQLLVATRKGLFHLAPEQRDGATVWQIHRTSFLAEHVIMALADPRDGTMFPD